MRITRRTSGGRGEYEISERTAEGISPSDIIDRRLFLHLGQRIQFDTGTILRHAQGKFRIRLEPGTEIHLHRQLVACLMLPEAIRANEKLGTGAPVIQRGRYAIQHIHIGRAIVRSNSAVLHACGLEVLNGSQSGEEINIAQRLRNLLLVWKQKINLPGRVFELVQEAESLIKAGGPIPQQAETLVAEIQTEMAQQETDLGIPYSGLTDVLPALVKALDVEIHEPITRLEEIEPEAFEVRKRVIKEWKRWAASRGAASAKFRNDMRRAYNSTCLVCGERYPSTPFNRIPGVDAAHILPWAEYDLDQVFNGICLCKTHHWAFDEGIIQIRFESGRYIVEIPDDAKNKIEPQRTGFTLDKIERYAGPVPEGRLPRNPLLRPKRELLERLRQSLE